MEIKKFNEKIADVKIFHDDDNKTEFALFYGSNNFPVNFPLMAAISFVNVKPDRLYQVRIEIMSDQSPLGVMSAQRFIFKEENLIFFKDGFGQGFITAEFDFEAKVGGTYKINFMIDDMDDEEKVLDRTSIYCFIGEN